MFSKTKDCCFLLKDIIGESKDCGLTQVAQGVTETFCN